MFNLKKIPRMFTRKKIIPVRIPILTGEYLKGKTAFICGGTGGIGYAIAQKYIENGCNIIISGTNEIKLKNACGLLGNDTRYIITNLEDVNCLRQSFENFFVELDDDEKIDILVNSAGVHGPSDFWNITENDWDMVMDINLKGMYFTCQIFAEYMSSNKIKGHILNIGSASALKYGNTPYEISKNGVKSLTLGLAEELIKYGIVVNCLAPGPTATKMLHFDDNTALNWEGNPSGRVATPDEIANWAVIMASDLGDLVVGDSFYVSGGSGTICIDK